MARAPKLRQHKGYWYTQAGNPAGVYFGRVDDIPYNDAVVQFRDYLADLARPHSAPLPQQLRTISVAELCDLHLKWIRAERSTALLQQLGFARSRELAPMRLSIDMRVQNAMHRELADSFTRYQAKAAAGVLIDVETGEIVAMVSMPDFDPNTPASMLAPVGVVSMRTVGASARSSSVTSLSPARGCTTAWRGS